VLALLLCLAPAAADVDDAAEDVDWKDASCFELEGRGWADTARPYDRLPARARKVVPSEVWRLSRHSAGLCVRFQAAARVSVRWSLTLPELAMPHMPATGVSGVDLYVRAADGRWLFVGNGRPASRLDNVAAFELRDGGPPLSEYLLYLPLYNGVKDLEIGVGPGGRIRKAAPRPSSRRQPILVYGTSIVQGGCASRPGMAWPSIVGRRLDRPVINLGFSGSGKMEPEVDDCLAELDPEIFIIDSLGNMQDLDDDLICGRVEMLVLKLRTAHPATPIVLVGQSSIRTDSHPVRTSRLQEQAVRRLRAARVRGLTLVSGAKLLGADREGTVDGGHPTDLGMMRQAELIAPILERILSRVRVQSSV
jgi:hypothetical protein